MIDYFLQKTTEIKEELQRLKIILRKIPLERKIVCRVELYQDEETKFIYKPRFVPKERSIDKSINLEFSKLLLDINNYLKEYSPDKFKNLEEIFSGDLYNKKSIIFLLEKDVWATDEVYGDYFVEKYENHYEISYFRWKRKVSKLENHDISIDIKNFITSDAISQVQAQFDTLWEKIVIEVEKSLKNYESLKSRYGEFKKNISLDLMLDEGKKALHINQFLSIYYLGYVLEHSIKVKLNKMRDFNGLGKLIFLCKKNKLITKSEAKVCDKIKDTYNNTKHKFQFMTDIEKLKHLYDKFEPIYLKLN